MTGARFKDYFSAVSASYARFRPSYPPELFEVVAGYAPALDCAWDCATGSGQAAIGLCRHFRKVVATDASPAQIEQATRIANVEYRVAPAEASGLEPGTVGAVTVAQALWWFDRDRFHAEVRRVCIPGAVLAVWMYGPKFSFSPQVDATTDGIVALFDDYWPPVYDSLKASFHHLDRPEQQDALFSALSFPYDAVPAPAFQLVVHWDLAEWIGALSTSSAAQQCLADTRSEAKLSGLFGELRQPGVTQPRRREARSLWPVVSGGLSRHAGGESTYNSW